MYSTLIGYKVTPLCLEILKVRAGELLKGFICGLISRGTKLAKNTVYKSNYESIIAFAERIDAGNYEVIVPSSGKVVIAKDIFDQSFKLMTNQPVWQKEHAAWKNVYQKYSTTKLDTVDWDKISLLT